MRSTTVMRERLIVAGLGALLLLGLFLFIPGDPAVVLLGDGTTYTRMVDHLWQGAGHLHKFRILTPAIVSWLPVSVDLGFRLVTFFGSLAAALLTVEIARAVGLGGWRALLVMPMYLLTWPTLATVYQYRYVDPLAWAFAAGALLAVLRGRFLLAIGIGGIGMLAKEMVFPVIPLAVGMAIRDGRAKSRWRLAVAAGAALLPYVAVRVIVSAHMPATAPSNAWLINLPGVLNYIRSYLSTQMAAVGPWVSGFYLFAPYAAFWVLAPLGFLRLPSRGRWVLGSWIVLTAPFILVGSPERMLEVMGPALLPMAACAFPAGGVWMATALVIANGLFITRIAATAIPFWLAWGSLGVALVMAGWMYRGQELPRPWVRAAGTAGGILLLFSAAWPRFVGTDRLLWGSDELGMLLAGIRLHLLPWFNLAADVRDNFFKSLLMPVHGLGDSVFYYSVVAWCRMLSLPITEAMLFRAGAVLSLAGLALLFGFVRRLLGVGVALVVLVLAAWSPALIETAKLGYQVHFVFVLEIAIFYAYLLHVQADRWPVSLGMSGLMILCAGSELFYLAPVLMAWHGVVRGPVGFWNRKNLVVWGGYAVMMLVNAAAASYVSHRLDLTLLGHLLFKRQVGVAYFPDYNLALFRNSLDGLVSFIPQFSAVALGAAGLLLVWKRREALAVFWVGCLALLAGLAYYMRFQNFLNFIHLLLPTLVVVGWALTELGAAVLRVLFRRQVPGALVGCLWAVVLLPAAAPWRARPDSIPVVPPALHSLKAAGYAVRELGSPGMRVMVLSPQTFIPFAMEYYLGLPAAFGEGTPPQVLYLKAATEEYLPSRLIQRLGLGRIDAYLEFVDEAFPEKARFLDDLRALGAREVCQVLSGGLVVARIYSPRPSPLRRITQEEGERGFNERYARWPRLLMHPHAGAFYYFGAGY